MLIHKRSSNDGEIECKEDGDRSGIRTLDLLIKSQLLYQLS